MHGDDVRRARRVRTKRGFVPGMGAKIAGRNHFDKPLTIIGDRAYIGLRGATGQFFTVAQPAACAATATGALRFSESARFEIARADHRLLVRRRVRSPDAKGALLFDCGASHFREAQGLEGAGADSRPSLMLDGHSLDESGVVFICQSLHLLDSSPVSRGGRLACGAEESFPGFAFQHARRAARPWQHACWPTLTPRRRATNVGTCDAWRLRNGAPASRAQCKRTRLAASA